MGTLTGPGLGKFTCGDLATCSLSDLGTVDAGDITSGTFGLARIPFLPTTKITSGTFDADRIPILPISRYGSAVLVDGSRSMEATLSMGSHPIDEASQYMFTEDVMIKGTTSYIYIVNKADTMWRNLHLGWLDAHAGIYSYGTVDMQGHPLTGVVVPTSGSHAANKNYVDDHVWEADDITTGTFGTDRIPILPISRYGSAVLRDGSRILTADWDIGNGRMIKADKIRARDGDGLALYEDGGAGIFIKDGGNVGIGTVCPGAKLDVQGGNVIIGAQENGYQMAINGPVDPSGADLAVYDVASGGGALKVFNSAGTLKHQFGGAALNVMNGALYRGYSDELVTKTFEVNTVVGNAYFAGNVGIGTTNPGAKLDVNGDGRFAGTLDMSDHPIDDISKIGFRDIHDVALITEGTYSLSVVNKAESVWGIIETGYSYVHAGFAWYIEDKVAGENLIKNHLVYLKSDGKWWKTDADAEATTKGMLGLTMQTKSADQTVKVLVFGRYTYSTWSWTVGAPFYVAPTAGAVTQVVPTASGQQVRKIGHALSSNTIIFNPDATILEIT